MHEPVPERHGEEQALLVEQPRERPPAVRHELEGAAGGQAGDDAVHDLLAHHRDHGGHVRHRRELAPAGPVEEGRQAEELARPHDLHQHRHAAAALAEDLHRSGDQEVDEVVRVVGREDLLTGPPVRDLRARDDHVDGGRREAEPGRVLAEQRAERRLRRRGRRHHAGRDRHIGAPDTSLPGLPRYRRGVAASCRTAAAP